MVLEWWCCLSRRVGSVKPAEVVLRAQPLKTLLVLFIVQIVKVVGSGLLYGFCWRLSRFFGEIDSELAVVEFLLRVLDHAKQVLQLPRWWSLYCLFRQSILFLFFSL